MISQIRNVVLAALFGLIVGVVSSVWLGREIFKERPPDVAAIHLDTQKHVEEVAKTEVALEEKRDQVRTEIKYITKEIVKYVPATETTPDCSLTLGAVGLLNAARTGSGLQPSIGFDAQGQTSTAIGLRELSMADIKLAEQYRELAADHDALVEYVEDYQARLKEHLSK